MFLSGPLTLDTVIGIKKPTGKLIGSSILAIVTSYEFVAFLLEKTDYIFIAFNVMRLLDEQLRMVSKVQAYFLHSSFGFRFSLKRRITNWPLRFSCSLSDSHQIPAFWRMLMFNHIPALSVKPHVFGFIRHRLFFVASDSLASRPKRFRSYAFSTPKRNIRVAHAHIFKHLLAPPKHIGFV